MKKDLKRSICAEIRNNKWNCEGNTSKCFQFGNCSGCGCKGNKYRATTPIITITRRDLKRAKNS